MILAGDVGGTKCNLAIYRTGADDALLLVRSKSYASRAYLSLEEIVGDFFSFRDPVRVACFGVAGPVIEGRSRLTNLPWVIDEERLRRVCGARRACLINDLQATAFSVPFLGPQDVEELKAGANVAAGNIAVIAAGTGLGQAFLVRDGARCLPVASEGGHADFAPRNDREIRLVRALGAQHGRVSLERVLSGPGLHAIYRFLREDAGFPESPDVEARLGAEEPPQVVAEEGQGTRSPACAEALRIFCSIYGAAAGNIALQVTATGGVYLAGGIAPAILPALKGEPFLDAFLSKGRFREFLAEVPVKVILRQEAVLLGAARYAQQHA